MAQTSLTSAGERDRPHWLPWSAFPFRIRFADVGGMRIHYVDEDSGPALLLVSAGQRALPGCAGPRSQCPAGAQILERFIDALDLQDITMVVHDAGGPLGFPAATRRPERFRALVITNTFGWPLAGYPAVRRTLEVAGSRPFGAVNNLTNVTARFTASRYGVRREMSRADRRTFLGPWRSRNSRRATQQTLAGVLRIDPVMAEVERSLRVALADLPVLTLFGRKNDRYGWQARFGQIFPQATAIERGHHFPFDDDPDAYSGAICMWWAQKVAPWAIQPVLEKESIR
jgi:pimeloyl-ACP methyl ester carboxylesterase